MSQPTSQRSAQNGLQVAVFFLLTAMPVAMLCWRSAASGGLQAHPGLVPLCMLTPMLSALVVQKISKRPIMGSAGLGISRGRLAWWVLAPLGLAAYVVASLGISALVTPSVLLGVSDIAANVRRLAVPHDLSISAQIAIALATTVVVGPLVNIPIFLGEEIGWRGFMNPRLVEIAGKPGLLLGGLLWAAWHLPFILLGHNYPQHPAVGFVIWVPVCICLNIILHGIRQAGRSVIPCALGHGMINQLSTLLLIAFFNEKGFLDFVDGPAGIIGLVVIIGPAAWVYRNLKPASPASITKLPETITARRAQLASA